MQKYSNQKIFVEKSSKNFYRIKKIVNYTIYEFICTFKKEYKVLTEVFLEKVKKNLLICERFWIRLLLCSRNEKSINGHAN